MKNKIPFLVALVCFAGLGWSLLQRSASSEANPAHQEKQDANSALEFKEVLSGTGVGDGDEQYPFTLYAAPDGGWVRFASERPAKGQTPNEVLEKRLGSAKKVLEKKWVEKGHLPRELRAVAIFGVPQTAREYFAVFWTEGRDLRSIKANSLKHAIEFEDWLLRNQDSPVGNPEKNNSFCLCLAEESHRAGRDGRGVQRPLRHGQHEEPDCGHGQQHATPQESSDSTQVATFNPGAKKKQIALDRPIAFC